MELSAKDKARLAELNQRLQGEVTLGLQLSNGPQSDDIRTFCALLDKMVSNIRIVSKDNPLEDMPGIHVAKGVCFHAVPFGKELDVFIEAIEYGDNGNRLPLPDLAENLKRIVLPAELKLFVSLQCPFCPTVVRSMIPLAMENELIHLKVIEGDRFPGTANKMGIRSVPTLVLDDQFRWTGKVNPQELVGLLIHRDPGQLSHTSLQGMLAEGDAAKVAQMMLTRRQIFPAFLRLLTHAKWPVRLGAMVVMEEIRDADKRLAASIVPHVWKAFQSAEEQVQGDIAYIIGEVGGVEDRSKLETIAGGDYHKEVIEAALDALGVLERRIAG